MSARLAAIEAGGGALGAEDAAFLVQGLKSEQDRFATAHLVCEVVWSGEALGALLQAGIIEPLCSLLGRPTISSLGGLASITLLHCAPPLPGGGLQPGPAPAPAPAEHVVKLGAPGAADGDASQQQTAEECIDAAGNLVLSLAKNHPKKVRARLPPPHQAPSTSCASRLQREKFPVDPPRALPPPSRPQLQKQMEGCKWGARLLAAGLGSELRELPGRDNAASLAMGAANLADLLPPAGARTKIQDQMALVGGGGGRSAAAGGWRAGSGAWAGPVPAPRSNNLLQRRPRGPSRDRRARCVLERSSHSGFPARVEPG